MSADGRDPLSVVNSLLWWLRISSLWMGCIAIKEPANDFDQLLLSVIPTCLLLFGILVFVFLTLVDRRTTRSPSGHKSLKTLSMIHVLMLFTQSCLLLNIERVMTDFGFLPVLLTNAVVLFFYSNILWYWSKRLMKTRA